MEHMNAASKEKKTCFVPECRNSTVKTPEKVFFCVPSKLQTRRAWAKAARRVDAASLVSRHMWYCCEDHFTKDDFSNYMMVQLMEGTHRLKLKKGVIPSRFDCQEGRHKHMQQRSSSMRRHHKSLVELAMEQFTNEDVGGDMRSRPMEGSEAATSELGDAATITGTVSANGEMGVKAPDSDACDMDICVTGNVCGSDDGLTMACQTDPIYPRSSMVEFVSKACQTEPIYPLQDEGGMSAYEESSDEADDVDDGDDEYHPSDADSCSEISDDHETDFDFASLQRIRTLCEMHPKRYLGVPADAMFVLRILAEERIAPTFKSSKLQPFDVVLLVLMKIKQDRQFEFLADDFGIDRSYAGRLFAKYVDPIAQALKDFIVWPADELIAQNVPLAFKARFSDVTCIIDCMEIEIEKPSAPVKQAQTWSSYKSANTLKYLVSILPNGLVNFVSEGYGGRVTDMSLISRCGFLERLQPGMVVMADRGFKGIGSVLTEKGCRLVRPESVIAGVVPSKKEVLFSKQVASLRIHVERAIRRIREFAMLRPHAVLETKLIGVADECVSIACGLINVQPPLVKV